MIVEQSYCQRFLGAVIVFCALFLLYPPVVKGEFRPTEQRSFERQLIERSQAYLESTKSRTALFPPDQRDRMTKQARDVVEKGLAKLKQPSDLIRKQTLGSADFKTISEAFQNIDGRRNSPSVMRAVAFLQSNFHQPSELEIAVRVALPSRLCWARRFGILAAHQPFSGPIFSFFGFGPPGCSDMIVTSSPSQGSRSIVLGQCFFPVFPDRYDNAVSRFLRNENLLSGFPEIARTIVLRI